MRLIDCHMHVHGGMRPWGWSDDADVIEAADRLGIEKLAVSIPVTGGRWAEPAEVRDCNDAVYGALQRFPDRLLGYCFVNPGFTRAALDEIERCVVDRSFIGVKLYNQYRISDPTVFPVIERCIELGVPILSHAGRLVDPADQARQPLCSDAGHFVEVNRRYPEATLIEGHIAGGGDWEWSLGMLREGGENLFLDTSGSVPDAGMLERCVESIGADRLLFATDMTMEGSVARLLDAEISDTAREQIAWQNFENILGRRRI